ncbi:DNRLRE domain-containing protein [Streptomyces sp. NPDC059015]|uniref:golvesin C-terminal-like domain-containing protein n=1 Tax=unclassified Streptomyces TaxID=2593676 RepID=UPI0036D08AA1
MVLSDQPSLNFDTSWKLAAGKTDTGTSRSLIKFPLNEVPAGTKIDSARLEMYFDQAHTTNGNDVAIGAYRATGAWDESTANWSNTSSLVGELSGTSVQVDDGDAGTTAAVGTWPASGSSLTQYAIGQDYRYNKDTAAGDTYTWQPKLPETASYRVDVHYVAAADRATNAPYTVTGQDGTATYTVNQQSGTNGVWASLNGGSQIDFDKGTAGKVVLGDGPASSTTAVIADAVRWVNPASIVKNTGEYNQWHKFPVTDTVQKWLDGTANHGFVLKATDESGTAPTGGPRYEAGDGDYGGETATVPRLTVTYGTVGTALDSPTVVHGTGPELSWKAYDNTTGDSGLDIVEYQLHRSTQQAFTPSAATLIAPIAKTATAYTDTTAVPTPDSSPNEIGKSYYYQIAVRTEDGQVLGSPTRAVGIPKAGRTMKLIQGTAGVTDTTLSSAQPTTNQDAIQSWGVGQKWLGVGNNSATYGKTRAAMKFTTSDIPTTATVLESRLFMWGAETTTGTNGAVYELHGMTRDFNETQATWNNATSTTAWTTPGGDHSSVVSDYTPQWSNDVGRHWWDATSLTQGWVDTPSSNKGAMVRLKDESATGPQERTLFLSSEAADYQLGPLLRVIYVDSTTQDTYYAPQTPSRMTPNSTYTVDFTVTNTTSSAWAAGERELSYTWKLPDGTDVTTGGNQVATAIPALLPGKSATIQAQVKTPINSDSGNKRTEYVLGWDVRRISDGSWLSAGTGGISALKQDVAVEDSTSNTLGLEKFYSYTGKNTGAGSTVMNNLAAGNSVWSYNAVNNPGRGLNTFARVAYNSLDTSDTVTGHGWSAQLSGPTRLGAPLDFHPNPNPTEVRLPDGDGTTHVFRWDATNSVWKAPAGVHYKLEPKPGLDCKPTKDPIPDAWTLTRPDGTRFLFGCDGYMTSAVDKNGNTQTYTYEERKSNNKPTKFLKYITDPAGRQSLTIDYYKKGDATYEYIDDSGVKVSGTNLTNSKIYDHVKSMTDISGRKISFYYTDKGLLGQFTDGVGSGQPKVFKFTYDATQGNKNVKLVKATDPRGNATDMAYYAPQAGDDPKYHWWAKTITDRLNGATGFTYAANATNSEFTDTKVTDAESNATDYVTDDFFRPVQTTNAKSQTTKMSWDADNNVTYLEEANGAKTAYCHDQKTGYPLWQRDAENNKAGVPPSSDCAPGTYPANAQKYEYQTRADGYAADLVRKTSPEGRAWQFGYDTFGNLKTVTDPKGVATATAGDYTTSYDYDSYGQLTKATDPNGNPTRYGGFGPVGYPSTITDALSKSSTFVYDLRGQVTQITDALGKSTTQTYDTFGRPLTKTVPKDQAAGVVITTPAPVYDANDNVTASTAPNGAVMTATYDAADQMVSSTDPKDTPTGPERRTDYTYDKTGHLRTTTQPKGTATNADPNDYVTTHNYNEIYELTSVVNSASDKISYEYDNVGNLVTVIDPKKNATTDTTDYTAKTAYDLNHRSVSVADALGKTNSRTYDKDSLVVSTKDADGNETLITYDERGKKTQVKAPHTGTNPNITYRTTKYEYDQVGNTVKVITPRGVDTAAADDFTQRTEYDVLNRPVKQFQPYDPTDARYNDPTVYTQTFYDAVGRVSKTSMPPSEGQTVRNDASYSYYDNGWTRSTTDPWDIVTTYDYNELGRQTARTLTSAGGSSNRTMSWSFYPDGKLRSKSDDGVPVGSDVVLVDNSDTQSTTSAGTWTKGDLTGQQGYDHQVHAAGTGTDTFTWTLSIPTDGTYTAYVRYPQVTGAAAAAKYTVTKSDGTTTDVVRDQSAGAGAWVSLGSFVFTQGNAAKLELFQNSAGAVVADGVKLVRDNAADTDDEKHTFAYAYDVNGNLTSIDDTSPGAETDAYAIAYTGLDQIQKVTESLSGQEQKYTSYTYDSTGQPLSVTHPDQFSEYAYDARDLTKTISIGSSPSDPAPKVTSYTYTDRGQVLQQTKANGNTVDYTYYLDGAVKNSTEKKAAGTLVASHAYTYDAHGNVAQDVAKKMNADDNAAYLESTTAYTYDPVDRLAKSVKTGNGASTDTYVHDDNANVVSQNVKGTATTFNYDRNRLLSASVSGTAFQYHYDPFGRQVSVTSTGKVVGRSVYDGFDHVVESQKMDGTGAMKSTRYTFDSLDRTQSKTADGKTTDFSYLGLSSEVLGEEVSGQLTASYQYSPWGERLSQVKRNTDGTTEDAYYSYNRRTDVDAVTDKDGNTKSTYGYTAYGSDDTSEFTGIDKPDGANPAKEDYNPYRYNSKRWDAQSGTYDMGFRDYNPGLNRFITRDMYTGALADMNLGMDPYTGNRYAFTGGNPTSFIELDGHLAFLAVLVPVAAVVVVAVAAAVVVAAVTVAVEEAIDTIDEAVDEAMEEDNEPAPAPTTQPRPGPRPGDGSGSDTDNRQRCDSEPKSSRFRYQPLDGAGRAQGATALICPNDLKAPLADRDTGAVDVYGFPDPAQNTPRSGKGNIFDRTHIVGDKVGGDWVNENLFTGFSRMNKSGMRRCEVKMERQLAAQKWVMYTGKVNYSHTTGIADSITMSAYTEDGVLFENIVVKNITDWQTTC